MVLVSLCTSLLNYAQQSYKGKIVDRYNNPLPGATIIEVNHPS